MHSFLLFVSRERNNFPVRVPSRARARSPAVALLSPLSRARLPYRASSPSRAPSTSRRSNLLSCQRQTERKRDRATQKKRCKKKTEKPLKLQPQQLLQLHQCTVGWLLATDGNRIYRWYSFDFTVGEIVCDWQQRRDKAGYIPALPSPLPDDSTILVGESSFHGRKACSCPRVLSPRMFVTRATFLVPRDLWNLARLSCEAFF